jgi:hypothetical protein
MNSLELVALLRKKITEEGGIVRFSVDHQICMGYLRNVLYCGAKPGPKIGLALGMKKTVRWEPIK